MPVFPFNLAGLTDASTDRTTQYLYDWRDRMIGLKAGVQGTESSTLNRPIVIQDLDNLGETTATYAFDGDNVALSDFAGGARDAGGQIVHGDLLRGYQTTAYDDQGRAYQQKSYSVDPATGVISSMALTSQVFYDHRGNVIEAVSPSGLVTKQVFDGVGRLIKSYHTDGGAVTRGSINLTWAAASSITADWVIDQTEYIYDKNSNLIETIQKDRFHDATGSGELGDAGGVWRSSTGASTATGKPASRVSYQFAYYDAANRLTASVNAGTNGGAFLARPGSPAARGDTMLVDSYAFNLAGWVDTHTDPKGIVEKLSYDGIGRTTQIVEAYTNGVVTATNNQTIRYAYNAADQVTTMTAVMPTGTPSQVTAYTVSTR